MGLDNIAKLVRIYNQISPTILYIGEDGNLYTYEIATKTTTVIDSSGKAVRMLPHCNRIIVYNDGTHKFFNEGVLSVIDNNIVSKAQMGKYQFTATKRGEDLIISVSDGKYNNSRTYQNTKDVHVRYIDCGSAYYSLLHNDNSVTAVSLTYNPYYNRNCIINPVTKVDKAYDFCRMAVVNADANTYSPYYFAPLVGIKTDGKLYISSCDKTIDFIGNSIELSYDDDIEFKPRLLQGDNYFVYVRIKGNKYFVKYSVNSDSTVIIKNKNLYDFICPSQTFWESNMSDDVKKYLDCPTSIMCNKNGNLLDLPESDNTDSEIVYGNSVGNIPLNKGVLYLSKIPLNLTASNVVKGFNFNGIQPENTNRKIVFKVDNVWNKLTVSGNTASLTPLSTQDITIDIVLDEGNTIAELSNVTSIPNMAGKLVYPAIALYAGYKAELMPTFGMNMKYIGNVDVFSYTDYSQEYVLSDGEGVAIYSVTTDTTITGNASINCTARIKQNNLWSNYVDLINLRDKRANAIQFKAVYTVTNLNGIDTAKINNVTLKYADTVGSIISGISTDIVTKTERFTNDLSYIHAYVKHRKLIDSDIKIYAQLRKTPLGVKMKQIGYGTGTKSVYQLSENGINQDTIKVYINGAETFNYDFNTELSQLQIIADNNSVISVSYEYGWELFNYVEMQKGVSQVNDSGAYTTEYSYIVPTHDGEYTVTAIKYELIRPEGKVTNDVIGVGTGKRQIIQLPHYARKETIQCNGKWSYDYDSKRLTVIAPEGDNIVISYDWIAESPVVYGVMAGWAD